MMELTEKQRDVLIELVNIAFGRAAASLSDLAGKRIEVSFPSVEIYPIEKFHQSFSNILPGEIATVNQIFSGAVSGNALLLLDYEGAVNLSSLLRNDRVPSERLDQSDCEVLAEVGNIILNACLGTFGNILRIHISFSVPCMHIESIPALFRSFSMDERGLEYTIVGLTNFTLKDMAIGGHLVIVLGVSSLRSFLDAVERI